MALSRNPVNLLWWLVCAFAGVAGIMWDAGWRLLPLLLIVVYAGAVVVLFLFTLFMVPERASSPPRGILAAVCLTVLVLLLISPSFPYVVFPAEALLSLYLQAFYALVLLLALLMLGLMAAVLVRGRPRFVS